MKIQYGLRAILVLVLAAGIFMRGWVANESYRTYEVNRNADEAAKQAGTTSKIANMGVNAQIKYLPGIGVSITGTPADVKAVEQAIENRSGISIDTADLEAIEQAIKKFEATADAKEIEEAVEKFKQK